MLTQNRVEHYYDCSLEEANRREQANIREEASPEPRSDQQLSSDPPERKRSRSAEAVTQETGPREMITDDTIPVKEESQSPFQARPAYPQKESDLLMEQSDLIQGSGPPLVPAQGDSLLRLYILLRRTNFCGTYHINSPLRV